MNKELSHTHIANQGISWVISDIYIMTKRNLIKYIRLPQLLVFSTIQPVMFLLLFAYVFGGAIATSEDKYINYLIPGIIVQTVVFGAMQTGVGLAEDLTKGLIDRFRSLPMARSAVLAGRTISDTIRNLFVVILMVIVGFLIGFKFDQSIWRGLAAIGLTLLFGFTFSWISATIGLLVKNIEAAQISGFIWVFPLVFASSIFVPVETMPNWLKTFAEVNPISLTVNSVRTLVLTNNATTPEIYYALMWMLGLLLIFVPIAILLYRKSAS